VEGGGTKKVLDPGQKKKVRYVLRCKRKNESTGRRPAAKDLGARCQFRQARMREKWPGGGRRRRGHQTTDMPKAPRTAGKKYKRRQSHRKGSGEGCKESGQGEGCLLEKICGWC